MELIIAFRNDSSPEMVVKPYLCLYDWGILIINSIINY